MDVNPKIVVIPKSSILIGVLHYKPSILGYPYFWKYPYEHWQFLIFLKHPQLQVSQFTVFIISVFSPLSGRHENCNDR